MSDSTQTTRFFQVTRNARISGRPDIKIGDIAECIRESSTSIRLECDTWTRGYALFSSDEVIELSPKTTTNPLKETVMHKIDFTKKKEIPETGHIMLIRNSKMYTYDRTSKVFTTLWSNGDAKIHADQLLDTDILYNFPTVETPYKYVSGENCLDTFKIKTEINRETYLKELLTNGAFIVRTYKNTKEVLKLEDDKIKGYDKYGQIDSHRMTNFVLDVEFHQFDNEFKMFRYLYQ